MGRLNGRVPLCTAERRSHEAVTHITASSGGWVQMDSPPWRPRSVSPHETPFAALPRTFMRPVEKPSPTPAWREHASVLYDLLAIETLASPAPCIDWLPWVTHGKDGRSIRRELLVGTDSANELTLPGVRSQPRGAVRDERDYLCVLRVELSGGSEVEADSALDGQVEDEAPRIEVVRQVNHAGAVCAVAHDPLHPDLVATGTVVGEVLVFDLKTSSSGPLPDGHCRPRAVLAGHTAACRGVAWNGQQEGVLASAGLDGQLCTWDLSRGCSQISAVAPAQSWRRVHGGQAVQQVAFHPSDRSLLASVGGDGRLCLLDVRVPAAPTCFIEAHQGGATAVAFAPLGSAPGMLSTGGQDGAVRLWDSRFIAAAVRQFEGHKGAVECVAWGHMSGPLEGGSCAEISDGLLASSGQDSRVLLWDPQQTVDLSIASGRFAPELLFMHDAHDVPSVAFAWAPRSCDTTITPLCASADAAGKLHVWQPSADIIIEDRHRRRCMA
eukprot:TRINITY_DN74061_c0_g1_i1.p1 TRINITY_DN74061_c0_g1~~TRINITY_DN74061_c0_g1_i1.p1  ORF type:complete len:496 (+),score=72.81 TRINITY_DN74061_c0_g1_i1:177-1664(+)